MVASLGFYVLINWVTTTLRKTQISSRKRSQAQRKMGQGIHLGEDPLWYYFDLDDLWEASGIRQELFQSTSMYFGKMRLLTLNSPPYDIMT